MTENNYDIFRVHPPSPSEPSAIMNVVPCGNDFTVEYPDIVSSMQVNYRGQNILYQKFTNFRIKHDIFVVGGIKVDDEIINEDGKKYLKVIPIKNKETRKNISDLLSREPGKVGFL